MLLDASHVAYSLSGSDPKQPRREPSSAEMIASLKAARPATLLLTVTAVASCRQGQRGIDLAGERHGLFAECLAEG